MSKELIQSILKKDFENIKTRLEQGADINYKDKDEIFEDWTPLHHSVFGSGFDNEFVEISKFLVDKGAGIEALDYKGDTPIFLAIEVFSLNVLDYLVQNGGNINVKNKDNKDIFDIIIDRYYYDQRLDEEHIDEELEENKIAINKGEGEALSRMFLRIDAILKNGFDINSGEYSGAFRIIFEIGENKIPSKVLGYLFNKNANVLEDIGKENMPLLRGAIIKNVSIEVLIEMVDKIGINYVFEKFHNATPLLLAISHNKLDLVKELIKKGANPNSQNNKALKIAKEKQYEEIEIFLKSL